MRSDNYSRRTGGAGSRTNPLSDEDYKRQRDKLAAMAAVESERDNDE